MPSRCSERPGGRDPARVGVPGEEDRLLGVRAEAADDQQRDAVGAGGALHAVEGAGDVGPHPLPLALGQRAVVATARGHQVARAAPAPPLRSPRSARSARLARGDLEAVAHADADADGSERARVGERDARVARPVGRRGPLRRGATEREVAPPWTRGAGPGGRGRRTRARTAASRHRASPAPRPAHQGPPPAARALHDRPPRPTRASTSAPSTTATSAPTTITDAWPACARHRRARDHGVISPAPRAAAGPTPRAPPAGRRVSPAGAGR